MAILRPRLNDFYGIPVTQAEVDFAIPFLDEDIPLYMDPFLLWKSPSQQDNALHTSLINSFNHLGHQFLNGKDTEAVKTLVQLTECDEIGLGSSKTKVGRVISENKGYELLSLYKDVPQINKQGFIHFEEIQLLVDNVSKDRISDITCSLLKSFLIDYTIEQCEKWKIPINNCSIALFDYKTQKINIEDTFLPVNPENGKPIILAPKRWLRYIPWINYDDYFEKYYIKDDERALLKKDRIQILNFNRHNYDLVKTYTTLKEHNFHNCSNDPLFSQIPVTSSKRKVSSILKLPSGKINNADVKYEDLMSQCLASFLYPHLDFAQEQSRTDSGSQIRDLIFYNNRSYNFLSDIYDMYDSRQFVIEFKNVMQVEREHINQLNRYLSDQFGRFGIIFTRNTPPKSIIQNTIDLWSGQRKCILIMDDEDLKLMSEVYNSKQRDCIEVIKKKYIELSRRFPS